MRRSILKSKIHGVYVNKSNLEYEGSCTIPRRYLEIADIRPFEKVHILNVSNGQRLETYAIVGEDDSSFEINGAAAHLVHAGEKILILTYAGVNDEDLPNFESLLIFLEDQNRKYRVVKQRPVL
ncbi:MAG: aspartate 1-decarboxylase [bacterium]